jgi:flagellar biosynthesis protein FlhB
MGVWLWMMECYGASWFEQIRSTLGEELRGGIVVSWNAQQAWSRGVGIAMKLAGVAWPLVIVPWATGVGVRLLQTRLLFTWETLRPGPERLNLFSGLRRMGAGLVGGSLGRTVLQCLVACGIGGVVGWSLSVNGASRLTWTAGEGAVQGLLDLGLGPIRSLGFSLLTLGLADLVWQGIAYERRIRMTAQEVREELRNSERTANGSKGAGQKSAEVQPAPAR